MEQLSCEFLLLTVALPSAGRDLKQRKLGNTQFLSCRRCFSSASELVTAVLDGTAQTRSSPSPGARPRPARGPAVLSLCPRPGRHHQVALVGLIFGEGSSREATGRHRQGAQQFQSCIVSVGDTGG